MTSTWPMETVDKTCKITAKQSCLPVTALEFITIGQSELLLAGEGPYLKLLSCDEGALLAQEEVLPFKRVHGIRPADDSIDESDVPLVLVFGQKSIRLIQLHSSPQFRLTPVSAVIEASDWLLDVCWLSFADPANYTLSYITAHNVVTVYRVAAGIVNIVNYHSETNCILYSARLVTTGSNSLIAISGTVFNHILLWTVDLSVSEELNFDPSTRVPVRLSLSGHEGVILCVRLSDDGRSLVSVSDDRTVRVWTLPQDWTLHQSVEVIAGVQVLYGHTARVWDARLLPGDNVVSIGEDATCRVWSRCVAVRTVGGHRGRSMWSMAVDSENKRVATGGGDCGVRVFSLEGEQEMEWDTHLPTEDLPRSVCLHGNTALCHTDHGVLYAACVDVSPIVWRQVARDQLFSSYSLLALHSPLLAVGSLEGSIKLLALDKQGDVTAELCWSAHTGKVFSLSWLGDEMLLSCGPAGQVICWRCVMSPQGLMATPLATLELPPSKHRWVSVALHDSTRDTLLLGDRKGSLHVYRVCLTTADQPSPSTKPTASYRVHGPNGVTCLKMSGDFVYSAGRNGRCRKYSLSKDGDLKELIDFKPVKGMDWIEDLIFQEEDMLVVGFHTTDLVLYSTAQNKPIVKINCGGGHRSYDISSIQQILKTRTMNAVYVKQSTLCFRTSSLESYFTNPIIQPGFVGREALSLEILNANSTTGELLLAVGSEDCTIALVAASPHTRPSLLATLTGHLSSVKALTSSQGHHGQLLFSGGARASLKAWNIPSGCGPSELKERVELCGEVFLHNKHGSRKQRSKDSQPECRVMSLAALPLSTPPYHYLAAGCSDGIIRQFIFDEGNHTFQPLPSLHHHDHCILCTKLHPLSSHPPLLLSSATDGVVCVWSLHSLETEGRMSVEEMGGCIPVESVIAFKAHQSGVNDLITSVQDGHLTVVTVGDDNALTVTHLTLTTTPHLSMSLHTQSTHSTAHSSSITGIGWFGPSLVATTSVDQRLSVWKLEPLSLSACFTHDVADPATLKTFTASHCTSVVVCGVGMQHFCLQANHKL